MSELLTEFQKKTFLEDTLGIYDWETIFCENKFELLCKITQNHVSKIYYHNLHLLEDLGKETRIRDSSTIVARAFKRVGGNCIHLNYFMKILLNSLGYDAVCIAGTFRAPHAIPLGHCLICVNLSGVDYVVDLGSALPIHEPIDVQKLPIAKEAGGIKYEFIKISDSEYARVEYGADLLTNEASLISVLTKMQTPHPAPHALQNVAGQLALLSHF